MKNKHLSYDERLEIESGLKDNLSFKQIAKNINRDCTTISKEIKKRGFFIFLFFFYIYIVNVFVAFVDAIFIV